MDNSGENYTSVIPDQGEPTPEPAYPLRHVGEACQASSVRWSYHAEGHPPRRFHPETVSHTGHEDLPPSPAWVPALMFSLLGLGIAVILLNYVGSIWDTNNGILLLGLGMILGGIVTATQYR